MTAANIDILNSKGIATIRHRNTTFPISTIPVPMPTENSFERIRIKNNRPQPLRLLHDLHLPPTTECHAVDVQLPATPTEFAFVDSKSHSIAIRVGKGLIRGKGNSSAQIRISNLSAFPKTLRKGQIIGTCQAIDLDEYNLSKMFKDRYNPYDEVPENEIIDVNVTEKKDTTVEGVKQRRPTLNWENIPTGLHIGMGDELTRP